MEFATDGTATTLSGLRSVLDNGEQIRTSSYQHSVSIDREWN